MRLGANVATAIAATLTAALFLGPLATQAEAQSFPSHLKNCRKSSTAQEAEVYSVPAIGGGAGIVKITSRDYTCTNKQTRSGELFQLFGMTDAAGKEIIPFKYAKVLPFSTTGAVVIDHGDGPYPKNLMYRTYIAGKGEGKERFDLQDAQMLQPSPGCPWPTAATPPSGVSAVMGELRFNIGGDRSHVTLFTPEGKARKLEYVGGEGLKPAVQRVGDVLLARWRDDTGAARSGILDLDGRQVAPVLGNAAIWRSPTGAQQRAPGCYDHVSFDLFIEGPSLDRNASQPVYGPLLTPVDRAGQPAALPQGAIGMFPANTHTSAQDGLQSRGTAMWAVVFPTKNGFEFTLTPGSPSEALVAAPTASRYSALGRSYAYGGLIGAKATADDKWRIFRAGPNTLYGEPTADFDHALNVAEGILAAEASQRAEANRRAFAEEEALRAANHKKNWDAALATARIAPANICAYRVNDRNTAAEVADYVITCGLGHYAGLAELARAKGMSNDMMQQALDNEWERQRQNTIARAQREEQAAAERARLVNTDPMASYIPGQWERALRNAGNVAVDAITQSSDNWLEQRRAQYNADWQRSQRAY